MIKPRKSPSAMPNVSSRGDGPFRALVITLSLVIVAVFLLATFELTTESWASIRQYGPSFLTRAQWDPVALQFGALPFIAGTVLTALGALLLAVPLALCAAIFVTEYAPRWIAEPVSYLVELLAAIPSVIYGLWGVFVLVPLVQRVKLVIFQAAQEPGSVWQTPLLNWLVPTNIAGSACSRRFSCWRSW